MEGLSMGLDIRGFDINPKIVENARENLKFFSYPDAISEGNIHEAAEHYDTTIIDIPYGLLSITTKEIQRSIIKSARRIADRMVLVSLVEMNDDISDAGFEITDRCCVYKGDFKRFITVCR
jgi:tRNA G10  N-methylase Trm11